MDDEVRAKGDRPLKGGRQKRVVNHDFGSGDFRPRCDRADIDDAHQRIAGGFNQNERGRPIECAFKCGIIALVDEGDIELPPVPARGKQTSGAGVAIVRRHDQIIGPKSRQYQIDTRSTATMPEDTTTPPAPLSSLAMPFAAATV
jgi:hypothetical protein